MKYFKGKKFKTIKAIEEYLLLQGYLPAAYAGIKKAFVKGHKAYALFTFDKLNYNLHCIDAD